jgi:hypothetical protein
MPQTRDKVVYYNGTTLSWLKRQASAPEMLMKTQPVELRHAGIGFAPVAARMSMVICAPAETVWATVSKFGKQALWM